ncbi:MAG: hypothetical protein AB1801_26390 [Chloroflexota bacterium]
MDQRKDRIRIQVEGKEFNVVGGSFQDMLAAVKQINGRRFVGELKVWQLPGTVEELERQLEISGYRLEGGRPLADLPAQPPPAARPGGDRIRILVQGHQLAVVGGSFQDMLAAVKNLPGRRFNAEAKIWEIAAEVAVVKGMIQASGFELEGAEQIPAQAVPPMEPPVFAGQSAPPPVFEPPDFIDRNDDFLYEPPDWWDDSPPPAFDDNFPPAGPLPFEDAMPSFGRSPRESDPAPGGDQIRLRLGNLPLVVSGGSFQAMLAVVKKIPGRRFNPEGKVWEIPAEIELDTIQQAIKAAGFVLLPEK